MPRKMIESVKILQKYWNTYDKQPGFEDYRLETLIDDALYGLGIAIDEKNTFADGFAKFKRELIKHLEATCPTNT